ncbi:TRAP transporter small permease [Anaerotignum propionicum]|jgi:TRAP-type C4-dicarboxylate transport system permease small subunit|uniref:2,3-diketo-L-gulonate TRAP transporter small permease protein YiaM n=1 Tax=Anaerotignum propionicum DSM 1682 TaxID=991789 RepID=A0A0X8VCZ7_ANAPI|nr:TRAP transporter small permease [Anaerotignum propionicum]AMJ40569.1 2,3-diketo-L-gulonate TRAP transporter small permease protein YiaM [Anaerotignum propionicum DSM 1682]MEA5057056.1 TRAP transporter small permease [Anaerotignum propionicum]SHE38659.1 TRAP-type C4-dicarboxylate transport system, small permease component [[Clostridium] propionicum DSM 1682] [Anaerotignum propionicum DSM 1682]
MSSGISDKMSGITKMINFLFRTIEILIAIFLAIMIILTFANVVLRFVFHKGFAYSEEVARISFIYLVYLGSIVAMKENNHLMVDSLIMKVPMAAKRVIYFLIQGITIWIMALLTQGAWQVSLLNKNNSWVVTHYPVFFIQFAGVVLGVAFIIICIVNLIKLIILKEDPIDLIKPHDSGEDPFADFEQDKAVLK